MADYETWMRRRGHSDTTIRNRLFMAAKVARELGHAPEPEDVEVWLDAHTHTPRTRRTYLAVLNELARFGALSAEALDGLAVPKIPRSRARPLPLSTALALIDAAERPLRTWLALALYAGLRRAEIAELCGADVDVDGRTLHVVGKGSVARLVPISTALHDELCEVIDRGGRLWEISPNTLGQQVCRHMRRHGVPWGGAHRLRATCATAMVDAGADVQLVAEVLGHCDLGAFSSYVTPSLRRMRAAVEMVAVLPAVA